MSTDYKRVICLYRVSTLMQVANPDENDIPMQESACRNFINQNPTWKLIEEKYEQGVSGFKLKSKERDTIVELQKSATKKEFDVLLVFMFDRLGRRDDDTPFLVEWFTQNGIEVWSVKEGQQTFANHTDKLMNYIYYWQASGESIKTSMRTSEAMSQMAAKGLFTGGTVPFGYSLQKQGRTNKRGQDVGDLVIDNEEAEIVRKAFHYYSNEHLSFHSLHTKLANEGYRTRKGKCFTAKTLSYMLQNPIYIGCVKFNGNYSEPIEDLKIIDNTTFERIQKIMKGRVAKVSPNDKKLYPTVVGKTLLSGNIFCGSCGGRLTATSAGGKNKIVDGKEIKQRKPRYSCYNKTRHRMCSGQATYSAKIIDNFVSKQVIDLLNRITMISENEFLKLYCDNQKHDFYKNTEAIEKKIKNIELELEDLESEIMNVIRGDSKFSSAILQKMIDANTEKLKEYRRDYEIINDKINLSQSNDTDIIQLYKQLHNWGGIFEQLPHKKKKVVVNELIDKVVVFVRDKKYEVNIYFKHDFSKLHENEK